jgi:hypothetical protein
VVEPLVLPNPLEFRLTSDDLDIGAGFVEQGIAFECTLSCPDDGYAFPGPSPDINPLVTVGYVIRSKIREDGWELSELADAGGYDDTPCCQGVTVLEAN